MTSSRNRGRPSATDTLPRDEILDVALRTFATDGYDGGSIRKINRELGASHNLINQRFGTKRELWKAAVDYGFDGWVNLSDASFDPTVTDPLEQLRLALRAFILRAADRPELLALIGIEGRQNTDRLTYLYDTYIEPSQRPLVRLLDHLADEGLIRAISYSSFFFLFANGGGSVFSLAFLADLFDGAEANGQRSAEQQADLVAVVIVKGLRLF